MEQVYPSACPGIRAVAPRSAGWFAVALWRVWPSPWPEYIGVVEAPSAFAAVEAMMRVHGLWKVGYASVRALGGSLIYRAYTVFVPLLAEPEGETSELEDAVVLRDV